MKIISQKPSAKIIKGGEFSLTTTVSDTGFKSPTTNGLYISDFTNPENMYTSDGIYAYSNAGLQDYGGFGFNIPSGTTINGIEVRVQAKDSSNQFYIYISHDPTLIDFGSETNSANLHNYVLLGSSINLWGISWSPQDFSDANFILLLEDSGANFNYDNLQVKVYYTYTSVNGGTKPISQIKNITPNLIIK